MSVDRTTLLQCPVAGPAAASPASPQPGRSERLRDLARRVRRFGLAGRFDPESVYAERDEIAHELGRLARELERPRLDRPRSPAPATPASTVRRLTALATARAREAERLRALLAQALRRPRRSRPGADVQLLLPLPDRADEC